MQTNTLYFRISQLFRMIWHEISAHALNSIVAVVLGMGLVWWLGTPEAAPIGGCCAHDSTEGFFSMLSEAPFHLFHYSHTFFASITATLTAMRFSNNNIFKSILVGAFVPPVFCTISDILVPYWGGQMAGIEMQLHLCVIKNIVPVICLIFLGVTLGLLGSATNSLATTIRLSASSHFLHDFVSAAASLIYLVHFGYYDWTGNLAYVFILMLIAVVIPCMLSDFILPIIICAPSKLPAQTHQEGCAYSFLNNSCNAEKVSCKDGRNKTESN